MNLPTCTYIMPNSVRCNGLALKDKDRCRFHQHDAELALAIRAATVQRRCDMASYGVGATSFCKVPGLAEIFDDTSAGLFAGLNLPPLEDANSINLILTTVVRALSQQIIPTRNASLILYALQIASGNLKRTQKADPKYDDVSTDPAPPPVDYASTSLKPLA